LLLWFVSVIWEVFEDELRGFLVITNRLDFSSVFIEIDFVCGRFFSSLVEDIRLVFLIDWIAVEFVDWVLRLIISFVIVNFDCLLSLVGDGVVLLKKEFLF